MYLHLMFVNSVNDECALLSHIEFDYLCQMKRYYKKKKKYKSN